MRNELMGYLLDALDTDEHEQLATELQSNHQLRGELDLLRQGIAPLSADREHYEPPLGLARRTCLHVWQMSSQAVPEVSTQPSAAANWMNDAPVESRRWRLLDMAVAAGIFIAGSAVVIPAILQSRLNAGRVACQDKLHNNYVALAKYSDLNHKRLPVADEQGRAAFGGAYAAKLAGSNLLANPNSLFCQTSLSDNGPTGDQIPTLDQLNRADDGEYQRMVKGLGNVFAFGLGYRDDTGKYRGAKNLNRDHFPIMSDLPGKNGEDEGHHGSCGRNVLFESGRVSYLSGCTPANSNDHMFKNEQGEQRPGMHIQDSVLVPGLTKP